MLIVNVRIELSSAKEVEKIKETEIQRADMREIVILQDGCGEQKIGRTAEKDL